MLLRKKYKAKIMRDENVRNISKNLLLTSNNAFDNSNTMKLLLSNTIRW